jgi:hypothetical protein
VNARATYRAYWKREQRGWYKDKTPHVDEVLRRGFTEGRRDEDDGVLGQRSAQSSTQEHS